jgi:hypothetical protein
VNCSENRLAFLRGSALDTRVASTAVFNGERAKRYRQLPSPRSMLMYGLSPDDFASHSFSTSALSIDLTVWGSAYSLMPPCFRIKTFQALAWECVGRGTAYRNGSQAVRCQLRLGNLAVCE